MAEVKLLTAEQAARIAELREPELVLGALRQAGLVEPEPVDPLPVEAREIAAQAFESVKLDNLAIKTRAGKNDASATVHAAIAALRRGIALGEASGRPLTEEEVEAKVKDACDAAYLEVYGDPVPALDTPYVKAFTKHFSAALTASKGEGRDG